MTHLLVCRPLPFNSLPPQKNLLHAYSLTFTHTYANIKIISTPDPYWVSDKLVYGTSMCTYATVSEEQILSKTPEVGKSWPYFLF